VKPLTRGLLPPDPRSLSSTEFVELPRKKFLGTLLDNKSVLLTDNGLHDLQIKLIAVMYSMSKWFSEQIVTEFRCNKRKFD
jgi:hypothetical protein